MSDETVGEKACERTHKAIDVRLFEGYKRMSLHDEDISDMKVAIGKLTQIQETQSRAYDLMATRVKRVEDRQAILDAKKEAEDKLLSKFWYSPTGQWVIKAIVVTGIIITLTALGKDFANDALIKALTGK